MSAHSVTLSGSFGLSSAHPTGVKLQAQFIESQVNAAKGTSQVKVIIKIINQSDAIERWYRYLDGAVAVSVNGVVQRLKGTQVYFDLASGHDITLKILYFNGVNHRNGTTRVTLAGSFPQGYAGHTTVSATGHLTLNNAPAPPVAPVWPSNGNAASQGPGTSTVLNWISMENKAASGIGQISPYTALNMVVCQADYPDHFNPITLSSDLSSIAGGTLAKSNYAVQTFWYTSLGTTLPSQTVFATNVAAKHLLQVKPPGGAPKIATAWGIAVSRGVGVTADPTKVTIQKVNGSAKLALSKSWTEPVGGPTVTGGAPPSSSFANNFAWSTNTVVPVVTPAPNEANGQTWPTTMTFPTIGGFWYQFHLIAINKSGHQSSVPITYYAPGVAPVLGQNTNGDTGEGNVNTIYAPMANIGVVAQAFNALNISASVVAVALATVDMAARGATLVENDDAISVTNYCGDPRNYWLTVNSGGNNTASPYVIEANTAGYQARNAQVLPQQMTYAMQALGMGDVDRGAQFTFANSNNNTGATVLSSIFIGGDPDAPNTNASFPVPAGANTMQLSFMAWANSANFTGTRNPFPSGIIFNALYANGVSVAGETTVNVANIPVNALTPIQASYTLPANTSTVVASLKGSTANAAPWSGGFKAGETLTVTAFMLLFNEPGNMPYFDGGWPQANIAILDAGNQPVIPGQNSIPTIIDGQITGGAGADSGSVSAWSPQVIDPSASSLLRYPWSGWKAQWQGGPGQVSNYGGPSQISAPQIAQYGMPSATPLVWTDDTAPRGNITIMPFDTNAIVAIAGDSTMASMAGGILTLAAGQTYTVSCSAQCPGWSSALGNLARYRLVTNSVTGLSGATTTTSPAITASGALTWEFTVPMGTVAAYLAVEALTANPEDVVRFSKPTFHSMSALGYLGTANAAPIRVAQIQMPTNYRQNGWPTAAAYLLSNPGTMTFYPSAAAQGASTPAVVDPRSVATAADLRFLASQGYSQAAGLWTPWYSSGVHAMNLNANDIAGVAPYYASAVDNNAYSYQLSETQNVQIPSLQFDAGIGDYLYSDDLSLLGLTQYTVIMVLSLSNNYNGAGGLWSQVPTAAGGGPDTTVDLSAANWRRVDAVGASIQVESPGMQAANFQIGAAAAVHKPTYLAISFNPDGNMIVFADKPGSVRAQRMAVSGGGGTLSGTVVLGADAVNGLVPANFQLFELGVYFGAMTETSILREIQLLGQIYG